MVQVPTTPRRSVQVQPLDQQPLRYARSRNLVGEAVSNFGEALQQGAETWNAIEAAYDQAEAVDRDNRYATGIAEATTQFAALKGEAPAQQIKDQVEALGKQREELVASARSDRARNIIKRNLDVRYDNARIAMQRHADAEMFKFRDAGLESSIEIASKDAVRGYGTEQFDLSLATAQLRLNERAALNGWAPEQLSEESAKLSAAIRYDAVIALATQGEPTAALDQAEKWQQQFSPEQYSKLNQLLRPRVEAKAARELAPGIVDGAAAAVGGGSVAPKPLIAGNLSTDIQSRVKNADGSTSTVRTISIGTDEGEVLIPTVIGGKVVSDDAAIAHYRRTGENFGTFKTVKEADAYAEWLHSRHANQLPGASGAPGAVASALSSAGFSGAVVAGFLGNFEVEGGYGGAKGDGGTASGIAQWRYERRENFKRRFGKEPHQATAAEQAQFVIWEMQNPQAAGMTVAQRDAILAAKTPEQAADLIDRYYERSSGKHRERRKEAARKHASGGGGETALDPRMDPEFAEAAARKYASANNLSESQTDALIDAARDHSADLMRRRNIIEQEEERQFDQMVVDKGINLDDVTSESQLPADAWDGLSPSSQVQKRQQFARNKERIQKEREEVLQAAQLQQAILAGGAVDYADPGTKKAADGLYAQQIAARGQMDTQQLMSFNVQFATQIGFVPPAMRGQIRGQLRSVDPKAQIAAAATLAEIGARNAAILGDFSQEEIARAEQLNYYRSRGFSAADAVSRVGEMEQLGKSDRAERGSQFTALAKKAGGAEKALEDAFDTDASTALVGEFSGLWEQEFVRTGDIDLARATALAALRRTWGVSQVNGRQQVMRGAPEAHYGRIDRGSADAKWIRDQGFKELFGSGISQPNAKERFELRPWNRTIDGKPVYIGTLRQEDGTIVTAVDERGRPKLYRPDWGTSDAYKKQQKQRQENIQRARQGRGAVAPNAPRTPATNPGWKL